MSVAARFKLKEFIDHIVSSDPYDSNSFIFGRTDHSNGIEGEYMLRLSYVHGAAFIEGIVGKDAVKIKVFYNHLQGSQLWIYDGQDDGSPTVESYVPYRTTELYEDLVRMASA